MKELPFKMAQETEREKWRAETFWEKEPETIAWIDDFIPGIFWDVGANVGVYSLYAAARHWKKVHVHAFEPYYANFQSLEANVLANGFQNEVTPAVIALGRSCGFDHFYVNEPGAGASGGQIKAPYDEHGRAFPVRELYLVGTLTGDSLMKKLGPPQYIKIDVDGRELDVLEGMKKVLASPAVRSVLVEANGSGTEIRRLLWRNDFTHENKYSNMQNHSRVRRQREGIKAENIVFTRTT